MPRQQGLGCDDCGYLGEDFPAQRLRLGSKSSPLIIRKAEPPMADLLSQNAIFLHQIFDHLLLPLVNPTGNGNDEKRKWIQTRSHRRSLSCEHRDFCRATSQIPFLDTTGIAIYVQRGPNGIGLETRYPI